MAWRPDDDPGPAPPMDENRPISIVSISAVGPSEWSDDLASLIFDTLEREVAGGATIAETARLRWQSGDRGDEFGDWLASHADAADSGDDVEYALDDECRCGAPIQIPEPWTGRGVFECDACGRRSGVEVNADGSSVVWDL